MLTDTSLSPTVLAGRRLTSSRTYLLVTAAFGVWAILSAFVFSGPAIERADDVLVGIAFLGLAGYNYYLYRQYQWSPESPRIAVFVGLWLVPFSIHVGTGGALTIDSVLLGTAVALLNLYYYRRFRTRQ